MNFSGKHFEFAGTSSKDPLGDGSVSLIFAHIDTEMFKQPFGYPEYSSVYSGRLGRRGLTGTKRNDSCLEIETEIVSEKSGIPLASLRIVEQWLFSREAFAKLYIAEDEEDEADVQYINGEKKRLYLNCMLTEPEILTYAEGKVGWRVKIVCDAPWAWQDEHTQTIYSTNAGWYAPFPVGTKPLESTVDYKRRNVSGGTATYTLAKSVTIPENLPEYIGFTYNGHAYGDASDTMYVPEGSVITLSVETYDVAMGPYGYIDVDGVRVAQKNYQSESMNYDLVVPLGRICVLTHTSEQTSAPGQPYAHGLTVTTIEQFYVLSPSNTPPQITVDSDMNTYIYPDRVVLANESNDYYSVDLPDNLPSSVGFWDSQERHGAGDDFTIPITDYITYEADDGLSWRELVVNGTTVVPRTTDYIQRDISITEDVVITVSSYQWDSGTGLIPVTVINVDNTAARHFSLTNVTDNVMRKTEFVAWASSGRVIINNTGTIEDGAGNNLLPYMTQRNFPRLLSQYNNGQIGLVGENSFSIEGGITSVAFTFRNRRFLS